MASGIYLLLGTNIGARHQNMANARNLIRQRIGIIERSSAVYETAAWGKTDQPAFLNEVIKVNTFLPPESLLKTIHTIEERLGRVREEKWKERIIDIDILYYNDLVLQTAHLKIPHPEIQNRRFTLVPLCEIVPDLEHPLIHKTHEDLLAECPDQLGVRLVDVEC